MDVVDLLEHLVAIDSTNRTSDPTGPGEAAMAEALVGVLDGLGFAVRTHEVAPGRPDVVGVLEGPPGAPAVLLEAHLDTVPSPPGGIPITRTTGTMTGRGSCDCKASLAAMLVAVERLVAAGPPPVTLVVAGSVDEEADMTGSAALPSLLAGLPPVELVLIGEPTSLRPIRAHNGFARCHVVARGRSAHSSTAHLGVSAVAAAARLVTRVHAELVPALAAETDPVCGPALLTPALIAGGTAPNLVPDRCTITFDRRIPPSVPTADAFAGLDALVAEQRATGDDLTREEPWIALPGMALPADHPAVQRVEAAVAAAGHPATAGGVAFATDACRLAGEAGLPCIVLGPGSIDQAHTPDEWVDLGQVVDAVDVYHHLLTSFDTPAKQR